MAQLLGAMGALAGLSLGLAWWGAEVDVREDPPAVVCAGDWVTGCARVAGGLELMVHEAPDLLFSFEGLRSEVALGYAVRGGASPVPLAVGEGRFVPLSRWPQAETVTFYALSGVLDWAEVSSVAAERGGGAGTRMASVVRLQEAAPSSVPVLRTGEDDGGYRITMTPTSPCGGEYDLFGLWPNGGSTTVEAFDFTQLYRPGEDPKNAFTLTIEGKLQLDCPAFGTFQIAADDTAEFSVGDIGFAAGAGGAFRVGVEVSGVLPKGENPIRGYYVNWGGRADLKVRKWEVVPSPARLEVEPMDILIPWERGSTNVTFSITGQEPRVTYDVIPAEGTALPDWVTELSEEGMTIDYQKFLERRVDSATVSVALRHRYRALSFVSDPITLSVHREPIAASIQVDADNDGTFDEVSPRAFLTRWQREDRQEGYQRLLDFSPFLLRLNEGFVEQLNLEGNPGVFQVLLRSRVVPANVLWTGLTGDYTVFYRSEVGTCGPALDQPSTEFATQTLPASDGLEIPVAFLKRAQGSGGIFMTESLETGTGLVELIVRFAGSEAELFSTFVTFQVLPLEEMFVRVNLRGAERPPVAAPEALPGNVKEATCALYFLHGYNVNEGEALEWQKEMFRRLYRTNCRALFYGVTWEGDTGADYHGGVTNTFTAGARLADYVAAQDVASGTLAPTNNVFMAHSLGNMVVASAIQDHGMRPENVIMLNAAIPSEAVDDAAFNTETQGNGLVPEAWKAYAPKTWCSCWHQLFTDSGRPQAGLTWKNRFAKLKECNVLNLHSTGDEVLEVGEEEPSIWDDASFRWHAWQAQELGKGKGGAYGSTVAGWMFRNIVPAPEDANTLTMVELQGYPIFRVDARMMDDATLPTNRNKLLAHGIPALSCPIGNPSQRQNALTIMGIDLNDNDDEMRPNGWRPLDDGNEWAHRWLHSDIKDMDYFYTWKAFEVIVNVMPK